MQEAEIPETLIAEEEEAEEGRFFACYLLSSRSPRYKGHTYIGAWSNKRAHLNSVPLFVLIWVILIQIHSEPTASLKTAQCLNEPGSTQLYRRRLGRLLQALNHWEGLSVRSNLHTPCSLSLLGRGIILLSSFLNITVNFFSTQYTKHSAGCPPLPEQMKVKVCSMDELPSCTKLSDDLLENEDEWRHERECDEDMNSSTLPEETLLDFRTHNSAADQQSDSGIRMNEVYGCSKEVGEDECWSADDQQDDTGKIINEAYGCSEVVAEDCTEQFGFMASPVRMPSSNVTTSFDTEVTKDIGLCGSSDDMSVDLGRPAREQSTAIVADDDQSPSRSYLRPCGAEVIDLTTPAPL
ncbi:unnamed protein product [Prunus armeniaca]|uniref:Uncharacterized protein n=1 Tax=Prunus armeniaca TaxID=36596 RepID=A0A6J5TGB2_PRUAR|nr:unnamed protein product [Prunus armeniaca]